MATAIRIPVTGMSCAGCQARVQQVLEQEPGVEDAAVNLLMQNASVSFDPSVTTPERLVEAIRETGYGAELAPAERDAFEEQDARDRAQEEEFRDLFRKSAVSLIAGAVAMLLSVPLMSGAGAGHGTADPVMAWAIETLSPAVRAVFPWLYAVPATALSLALLGVTLAVMLWAGRHFYTRAWTAFRHHNADMNTLIAVGTGAAFVYSVLATVAPGFFLSRGAIVDSGG